MGVFSDWISSKAYLVVLSAGLLITLLLSALRKSGITRNGQALRKPPNTLPLVGNGLYFLQAREKLFAWFTRCERLFGPETFELYVPSLPPGVVINDPRNVDFVFHNEGIFARGAFMKAPLWDLFGHGIINSDGELWRVQRRAGLGFLSNRNLQVLTDVALPRYLAQSIEALRAASGRGREADLQTVFLEITSQLMGKMAYNMEMHADDDFTDAFDYASGVTAERVQNPMWRIKELFMGARMRRSLAVTKAFGKRIVDSAVEDREKDGKHAVAGEDEKLDEISGSLIQSLLDAIGDREMVADAALNYLSAGRDTTAQALTWAFHLLLQHRYVYAKVRNEVQNLLDTQGEQQHQQQSNSTSLPFDPTLFTPTNLPYTHAVFIESLRLYPPIPFEIKQVQTPTTLPDGTFLPATSIVVWCPWAMNRSYSAWGPDPDAFRPERWLAEDSGDDGAPPAAAAATTTTAAAAAPRVVMRSAAEFPVFNGGARTCLGRKMAESMAVQVIAAVVWTFDFVPAYEGRERRSKSSLTLPMEGGLPVFVKVRNRGAARAGLDEL